MQVNQLVLWLALIGLALIMSLIFPEITAFSKPLPLKNLDQSGNFLDKPTDLLFLFYCEPAEFFGAKRRKTPLRRADKSCRSANKNFYLGTIFFGIWFPVVRRCLSVITIYIFVFKDHIFGCVQVFVAVTRWSFST